MRGKVAKRLRRQLRDYDERLFTIPEVAGLRKYTLRRVKKNLKHIRRMGRMDEVDKSANEFFNRKHASESDSTRGE